MVLSPEALKLIAADYQRRVDATQIVAPASAPVPIKDTSSIHQIVGGRDLWRMMEPQLESSDFYMLMVNGQQGSGKTTVAREIAHYAHSAKNPYKLLYTSGYDIETAPARFKAEAAGAPRVVIVFDDLSYILSTLSGKKQADIKSYFAVIRHDLKAKILCIINSHFQTATPPIFRNASQWIFTKPSMVEFDTMQKIAGRNQKQKQALDAMFQNVVQIQEEGSNRGEVRFKYGQKRYQFKWNDEGRLMLLISNGNPALYQSKKTTCPICEIVGKNVSVETEKFEKRESDKSERE